MFNDYDHFFLVAIVLCVLLEKSQICICAEVSGVWQEMSAAELNLQL